MARGFGVDDNTPVRIIHITDGQLATLSKGLHQKPLTAEEREELGVLMSMIDDTIGSDIPPDVIHGFCL